MLCANARLCGPAGGRDRQPPRLSQTPQGRRASAASCTPNRRARWPTSSKRSEREGMPLIYLQDVSGFMVGPEAEREGIIRAGAEMVEAMACATVPKIVVTLNHASGAGYYAMAGQGFDPNFTFSWPTARIGVMEGDSAVVRALLRGTGEIQGRRTPRRSAARRWTGPAPITNGGWMRATPPRAGTATPSSIRWIRARSSISRCRQRAGTDCATS